MGIYDFSKTNISPDTITLDLLAIPTTESPEETATFFTQLSHFIKNNPQTSRLNVIVKDEETVIKFNEFFPLDEELMRLFTYCDNLIAISIFPSNEACKEARKHRHKTVDINDIEKHLYYPRKIQAQTLDDIYSLIYQVINYQLRQINTTNTRIINMYAIDEENKLFGKNAQNLFKNKKTVHSSFTLNLVGALAAVSAVLLITGVIALSLTTYNPYIITSVLGTTISAAKTIGFTSIGLSIASCAGALFFKAKTTDIQALCTMPKARQDLK